MLKGSRMSDESRRKMSEAAKRRPSNRLGKKHTKETREKISKITTERTQRGENHYAWKGGTKAAKQGDRGTARYRAWRKAVFERDNYTCQICTVYTGGGDLQAHHIKSYAEHPELRYDVDNGVTLCEYHHQREVHDGRENRNNLVR